MSPPSKLQEKADGLPTEPGVYLFKSPRGAVLYVGKAQNLRSRVRQYLSGGDGRIRVPLLMDRAAAVDVFVTPTVKDALLLENELIKKHRPPFNVRLRDDKQYLALRLDPRDAWPRLTMVRKFRRDGAQYFGPYTSSIALKDALSNLRRIFPLRSCSEGVFKDYARRGRPCIEYEMGRCVGPCVGKVEKADYDELVAGTALFLRGRSKELVDDLTARMNAAAEAERFEEAAAFRNRIRAVDATIERQQIVTEKRIDRDVFGLARHGGDALVQVMHVRDGRVVGAEDFSFSDVRLDDGEIMGSFLGQYYAVEGRQTPREVLTSEGFDDEGALESLLREQREGAVSIRVPQRGALRELISMATRNAGLSLTQRVEARESVEAALEEIRESCALSRTPRSIECYDVSNLNGTLPVASRVVFEDGLPAKQGYRRYKIKEAAGGDDYDCLREVMRRRLARVESEALPDLLMVDGGRGQLGIVTAALSDFELDVDTLGLSKERDSESASLRVKRGGGLKAERIFLPGRSNPVMLAPSSKALLLLQRVRDESHRFAIEFQRNLRSKAGLTSILEELPGIGPTKRRSLLRTLGSLKAVRAASHEALRAVPGVSARDAEMIRRFFDAEDAAGLSADLVAQGARSLETPPADAPAADDEEEASRSQQPGPEPPVDV